MSNTFHEVAGLIMKPDENYNANANQWLSVMKSVQSLDEVLIDIEGNLKTQSANIPQKIKELITKDQKSIEQSWEGLRTNWTSKCREISSLKKSVNRIAEEKNRLRDENQGLEKSISRLQKQFSQSVNSSLSEIQSLTAANSDLSDQIQKLEGSKSEYNDVKDSVRGRMNSLWKRLEEIVKDGRIKQSVDSIMKEEFKQMEKILKWNKFDETLSKDIVESTHELGKSIEGKRLKTMETHLQELEKEVLEKNERIRDLEKSNEDIVQERNIVVSEINEEERNWFDYTKRTLSPGKLSQEDCLEVFEISYLSRGIASAQQLVISAREGIAEVYQHTVYNQDELHEVKDSADEISIKLKAAKNDLESVEAENEYFKRKFEQEENKLKVSRDEVISLQGRIRMLAQEKDALETQIGDMKGGKQDFKEFCSNLSAENEKLFEDISRTQAERDLVLEQQQETGKKLTNAARDLRTMEEKCEVIERQLVKLKREYQEQRRELEHCVKENEELKIMVHEKEDSFSDCKNEFRNIDIVNKDLEDQIFQLTNENQKLKMELGKAKTNKKQLETELKEKRITMEKIALSERALEEKIRELAKVGRTGQRNSSNLKTELEINEDILEKSVEKVSGLAELLRQILKLCRSSYQEIGGDKEKGELISELDLVIQSDLTRDGEVILEKRASILNLVTRLQRSVSHKFQDIDRHLTDFHSLILKTGVQSEFPETNNNGENSLLDRLNQAKLWLSWILKDYKKLCEAPAMPSNNEDIRSLKEIVFKYVLASTKQVEAMFDSLLGKDCVIMLLPSCKQQSESSSERSNEDLLQYVRDTFRANQMALETAIGTLELVKLRGESDIISASEIDTRINIPEHKEICQMLKRMSQGVDKMTTRIQGLMTNAEMIRSPSSNNFDNVDGQGNNEDGMAVSMQVKALKVLVNKRDAELETLQRDLEFLKMEREQMMSEIQEKDFDLGKLSGEMKRLDSSSTALEDQLSSMKSEYDKSSKVLVEREKELVALREKMAAQQDREGDAGEFSGTESTKSEIQRKETELRRLRSSLEDIRNVHCTNEDRIKTLQNKIEGVTNFLSNREDTILEEEHASASPRHKKEQLLVVREIELKTSEAQFFNAENLKQGVNMAEGIEGKQEEVSRKLKSKEKENEYLQDVVKELKLELMSVQQSLSNEEQSKSEFNKMMTGKQTQKAPTKDPKFDTQKLQRRNMEYHQIRRTYFGDSDLQTVNSDEISLRSFNSPKHFGYPPMAMPHDQFDHDCEICIMESMSGASTYICSDEECDCNYASCELSDTSYGSDDEYERGRMVSPGFKGVISKEARNVSMQEATFAIKNQSWKNSPRKERSQSMPHNPPRLPRHRMKRQPYEYDQPVAKYAVTNLTRSNSARSPSVPNSVSSNNDFSQDRRHSIEKRSIERRPRSDGSTYYPKGHLSPSFQHETPPPKSPSHHSSDECSSMSSGSGACSGSGPDHSCRKRRQTQLRGKLV